MQILNLNKEGKPQKLIIFKTEKEGKNYYSTSISHKNFDGEYEYTSIPVKFRKNVDVEDKQFIFIKEAWLDFYIHNDKEQLFIFISDFDKVKEN